MKTIPPLFDLPLEPPAKADAALESEKQQQQQQQQQLENYLEWPECPGQDFGLHGNAPVAQLLPSSQQQPQQLGGAMQLRDIEAVLGMLYHALPLEDTHSSSADAVTLANFDYGSCQPLILPPKISPSPPSSLHML
jgi:hypothetical protein